MPHERRPGRAGGCFQGADGPPACAAAGRHSRRTACNVGPGASPAPASSSDAAPPASSAAPRAAQPPTPAPAPQAEQGDGYAPQRLDSRDYDDDWDRGAPSTAPRSSHEHAPHRPSRRGRREYDRRRAETERIWANADMDEPDRYWQHQPPHRPRPATWSDRPRPVQHSHEEPDQHQRRMSTCTPPARPASTAPSTMPLAKFAQNCAGSSLQTECSDPCSSTPQLASLVVHSLATWWTACTGVHHVKSSCAARLSRISTRRTAAPNARRPGAEQARPQRCTALHCTEQHRIVLAKSSSWLRRHGFFQHRLVPEAPPFHQCHSAGQHAVGTAHRLAL